MKTKYYIVLFSAICLSALLLGFSYSKESGTNQETFLKETKDDNFKVVSSNPELSTLDEDGTDISIVNRSKKESTIILHLERKEAEEEKDKKKIDIYYSINNSEIKKLTDSDIVLGNLTNYGTENDHSTYNIKITSKSEEPIYYNFRVDKKERKTLYETIESSPSIYKDENNNIRYYGVNVNNYIKYNNEVYRIVGIFNDKLRLISAIKDESNYEIAKNTGNLLSVDDYLRSFATTRVEESTAKSTNSWLREQQFWLLDEKENGAYVASAKLGIYTDNYNKSHNNRYIIEIEGNGYLNSGDGSINSPYEV